MEMLISQDWLRRKVELDPDMDTDAGPAINVLESIGMFLPADLSSVDQGKVVRLVEAFGVLVRQLRRDPHHRPRPRVVHQLATVFGVPERSLMKLSGATITKDHDFEEEAMRFAAKSDDMSKLSREEQRALNDYVKYLVERAN